MLAFIVSRLFIHTITSGILAMISGSMVGIIVGAIRRSIPDTFAVSLMGAFLGALLVCITPFIATPGSLETWGQGGGLGSLVVLMAFAFITMGGLAGSLVASTFGFRWFLQLKPKTLRWTIGGIYILMVIALAEGYRQNCFPSLSYC